MFLDELMLENDNSLFDVEDTQETRQFCEGVDELLEVALESEMTWSNIVMDTVKDEFVAIKNESSVLLEEAKENWFTKIIKWVKEKAVKVANFFKHLINKLQNNFVNIDKFLSLHKEELKNSKGSVSAVVYNWKSTEVINLTNSRIDALMKKANSISKRQSVEELCKELFQCELKDLTTKFAKEMRSESKEQQTVNVSGAVGALSILKGQIAKLQDTRAKNSLQLEVMKKKAEQGLKSAEDKTELKDQITSIKNVNTITDKITATGISLLQQAMSDKLTICRKALSSNKKQSKKDEKENAKAKQESAGLFDLI